MSQIEAICGLEADTFKKVEKQMLACVVKCTGNQTHVCAGVIAGAARHFLLSIWKSSIHIYLKSKYIIPEFSEALKNTKETCYECL